MKRQNNFFRLSALLAGVLMVSAILFTSCKKDNPVHVPAAGLMVFNLVPDQQGIDVTADNNRLFNTPLRYFNYSGNYLPLYTGNRTLQSYAVGNTTTLTTTTATLADSAYYSLFIMGVDGAYKSVFVQDKLDSLPVSTGNAFIRYVNGITGEDDHGIMIEKGSDQIFDGMNKPGYVSSFKEVTPGDINVSVSNEGLEPITRDIPVVKDGIYTILIAGVPNATDTSKTIKIKYIQNGVIVP